MQPFPHLHELHALSDVLDLVLVVLDHLLQLLPVHVRVNGVRDVGRRRGDAARRRHADPHGRDDDGGTEGERCQDEPRDRGQATRDAGHPAAHGGRHRSLVELIRGVGQGQELQDALLQRRPPLVEQAHEEASCHVDTVSRLLQGPAGRRRDESCEGRTLKR